MSAAVLDHAPVPDAATRPPPEACPDDAALADVPPAQEIVDAIEFQVVLCKDDDPVILVNQALARRFASLGVEWSKLGSLRGSDFARLLLDSGYIDRPQFAHLRAAGPRVDLEMTAGRSVSIRRFPMPDGRRVVVVMDVSEFRRAEQAHAAEQRLTTTGSLVTGIANEISTPLGVAVTAASFLRDAVARARTAMQDGVWTPERAERALAEVANATALVLSNLDRSAEFVQNLRHLTAEPAGDTRQRISIRRHVSGIVEALGSEATERGHALLVDCPNDVEMETSPGALTQVVANLVMNSLHHAFGNRPGGTVLVSVTHQDGQVRIVVGDDGVGLEPEVLPRIFDPFYTTRRGQGGRGLGLAIVHTLVTSRLGGLITTEGGPGEGLRQIVTIPTGRGVGPMHQ